MKRRTNKVVVEIVSTTPISEKEAIYALRYILEVRGVFGRSFMFRPDYTPRYHIRSWLKSFAYAAGKYQRKEK